MVVKIRKYVAKVSVFEEHEDGSISKECREITLDGKRFNRDTVLKKIPRESKLEEMGWKKMAFKVDRDKLEQFLAEHGELLYTENAE